MLVHPTHERLLGLGLTGMAKWLRYRMMAPLCW